MSDNEHRASTRAPDGAPDEVVSWQRDTAQAHLAGQALLDALERRAMRLGRHARRTRVVPERILKLMD